MSHKRKIWRGKSISFWKTEEREKRFLVIFSAYFESLKIVFVKICLIYVVIDWIIVCCLLFCDTCDSKNAKTPGMRVYARARGRDVIGIFTIRIGCSRLLFRGWVFSRSLPFIENNTSFSPKQHVVFLKTTRRFPQNNTSFLLKQAVIWRERKTCFVVNRDSKFHSTHNIHSQWYV